VKRTSAVASLYQAAPEAEPQATHATTDSSIIDEPSDLQPSEEGEASTITPEASHGFSSGAVKLAMEDTPSPTVASIAPTTGAAFIKLEAQDEAEVADPFIEVESTTAETIIVETVDEAQSTIASAEAIIVEAVDEAQSTIASAETVIFEAVDEAQSTITSAEAIIVEAVDEAQSTIASAEAFIVEAVDEAQSTITSAEAVIVEAVDEAQLTIASAEAFMVEAVDEAQSTITSAEAIMIDSAVVVSPLGTEEALQEEVSKEKERREQRFAELSLLQSQLSRSISKKQEVESIIIREIDQLRVVISEEITTVRKRLLQLNTLYDSFKAALLSKNVLLISESKILEQMKDVRSKITEQVILSQLDDAVEKKSFLIDIERGICDEIKACGENINAEISEKQMKLQFLSDTYASLPPVEDTEAARKYSWLEVEALQSSILDSIKSSLAADMKVKDFTSTFSSVMRRRGLILGVNTEIPAEVAATIEAEFPLRDTAAEEVQPAVKSVSTAVATESRMTREELASILGSQSDAEFSAAATEALRRTVSSIAAATASIFDISRSFFRSSEAEDAKQSVNAAATALVDIGKSVSEAFSAARSVWSSEVDATSEKVETTDEYVATLLKGVNRILSSEQVKGAVADVSKNAQVGAKELGVATSKASSRISTDFRESAGWQAALRDLSSSVSVLFTILFVGTKRLAGDRLDRQLPK
jgi:hypothetical protein